MVNTDVYGNTWESTTSKELKAALTYINSHTGASNIAANPTWVTGGSYAAGGNLYYPPGNMTPYTLPVNVVPSPELLGQPGVLDKIVEHMLTVVKPGDKVVICVDTELTQTQCSEINEGLKGKGISGIIIRGARAGTGFTGLPSWEATDEGRRVDILARIGEIWGLRPDLKLTDLLSWYHGSDMADGDFAAAVETHFMKVTNGVHGRP